MRGLLGATNPNPTPIPNPTPNQVRGLLGAMYERRELLLGLLVLGCLLCWQG